MEYVPFVTSGAGCNFLCHSASADPKLAVSTHRPVQDSVNPQTGSRRLAHAGQCEYLASFSIEGNNIWRVLPYLLVIHLFVGPS